MTLDNIPTADLAKLIDRLEWTYDEGQAFEGWQSAALVELIDQLKSELLLRGHTK